MSSPGNKTGMFSATPTRGGQRRQQESAPPSLEELVAGSEANGGSKYPALARLVAKRKKDEAGAGGPVSGSGPPPRRRTRTSGTGEAGAGQGQALLRERDRNTSSRGTPLLFYEDGDEPPSGFGSFFEAAAAATRGLFPTEQEGGSSSSSAAPRPPRGLTTQEAPGAAANLNDEDDMKMYMSPTAEENITISAAMDQFEKRLQIKMDRLTREVLEPQLGKRIDRILGSGNADAEWRREKELIAREVDHAGEAGFAHEKEDLQEEAMHARLRRMQEEMAAGPGSAGATTRGGSSSSPADRAEALRRRRAEREAEEKNKLKSEYETLMRQHRGLMLENRKLYGEKVEVEGRVFQELSEKKKELEAYKIDAELSRVGKQAIDPDAYYRELRKNLDRLRDDKQDLFWSKGQEHWIEERDRLRAEIEAYRVELEVQRGIADRERRAGKVGGINIRAGASPREDARIRYPKGRTPNVQMQKVADAEALQDYFKESEPRVTKLDAAMQTEQLREDEEDAKSPLFRDDAKAGTMGLRSEAMFGKSPLLPTGVDDDGEGIDHGETDEEEEFDLGAGGAVSLHRKPKAHLLAVASPAARQRKREQRKEKMFADRARRKRKKLAGGGPRRRKMKNSNLRADHHLHDDDVASDDLDTEVALTAQDAGFILSGYEARAFRAMLEARLQRAKQRREALEKKKKETEAELSAGVQGTKKETATSALPVVTKALAATQKQVDRFSAQQFAMLETYAYYASYERGEEPEDDEEVDLRDVWKHDPGLGEAVVYLREVLDEMVLDGAHLHLRAGRDGSTWNYTEVERLDVAVAEAERAKRDAGEEDPFSNSKKPIPTRWRLWLARTDKSVESGGRMFEKEQKFREMTLRRAQGGVEAAKSFYASEHGRHLEKHGMAASTAGRRGRRRGADVDGGEDDLDEIAGEGALTAAQQAETKYKLQPTTTFSGASFGGVASLLARRVESATKFSLKPTNAFSGATFAGVAAVLARRVRAITTEEEHEKQTEEHHLEAATAAQAREDELEERKADLNTVAMLLAHHHGQRAAMMLSAKRDAKRKQLVKMRLTAADASARRGEGQIELQEQEQDASVDFESTLNAAILRGKDREMEGLAQDMEDAGALLHKAIETRRQLAEDRKIMEEKRDRNLKQLLARSGERRDLEERYVENVASEHKWGDVEKAVAKMIRDNWALVNGMHHAEPDTVEDADAIELETDRRWQQFSEVQRHYHDAFVKFMEQMRSQETYRRNGSEEGVHKAHGTAMAEFRKVYASTHHFEDREDAKEHRQAVDRAADKPPEEISELRESLKKEKIRLSEELRDCFDDDVREELKMEQRRLDVLDRDVIDHEAAFREIERQEQRLLANALEVPLSSSSVETSGASNLKESSTPPASTTVALKNLRQSTGDEEQSAAKAAFGGVLTIIAHKVMAATETAEEMEAAEDLDAPPGSSDAAKAKAAKPKTRATAPLSAEKRAMLRQKQMADILHDRHMLQRVLVHAQHQLFVRRTQLQKARRLNLRSEKPDRILDALADEEVRFLDEEFRWHHDLESKTLDKVPPRLFSALDTSLNGMRAGASPAGGGVSSTPGAVAGKLGGVTSNTEMDRMQERLAAILYALHLRHRDIVSRAEYRGWFWRELAEVTSFPEAFGFGKGGGSFGRRGKKSADAAAAQQLGDVRTSALRTLADIDVHDETAALMAHVDGPEGKHLPPGMIGLHKEVKDAVKDKAAAAGGKDDGAEVSRSSPDVVAAEDTLAALKRQAEELLQNRSLPAEERKKQWMEIMEHEMEAEENLERVKAKVAAQAAHSGKEDEEHHDELREKHGLDMRKVVDHDQDQPEQTSSGATFGGVLALLAMKVKQTTMTEEFAEKPDVGEEEAKVPPDQRVMSALFDAAKASRGAALLHDDTLQALSQASSLSKKERVHLLKSMTTITKQEAESAKKYAFRKRLRGLLDIKEDPQTGVGPTKPEHILDITEEKEKELAAAMLQEDMDEHVDVDLGRIARLQMKLYYKLHKKKTEVKTAAAENAGGPEGDDIGGLAEDNEAGEDAGAARKPAGAQIKKTLPLAQLARLNRTADLVHRLAKRASLASANHKRLLEAKQQKMLEMVGSKDAEVLEQLRKELAEIEEQLEESKRQQAKLAARADQMEADLEGTSDSGGDAKKKRAKPEGEAAPIGSVTTADMLVAVRQNRVRRALLSNVARKRNVLAGLNADTIEAQSAFLQRVQENVTPMRENLKGLLTGKMRKVREDQKMSSVLRNMKIDAEKARFAEDDAFRTTLVGADGKHLDTEAARFALAETSSEARRLGKIQFLLALKRSSIFSVLWGEEGFELSYPRLFGIRGTKQAALRSADDLQLVDRYLRLFLRELVAFQKLKTQTRTARLLKIDAELGLVKTKLHELDKARSEELEKEANTSGHSLGAGDKKDEEDKQKELEYKTERTALVRMQAEFISQKKEIRGEQIAERSQREAALDAFLEYARAMLFPLSGGSGFSASAFFGGRLLGGGGLEDDSPQIDAAVGALLGLRTAIGSLAAAERVADGGVLLPTSTAGAPPSTTATAPPASSVALLTAGDSESYYCADEPKAEAALRIVTDYLYDISDACSTIDPEKFPTGAKTADFFRDQACAQPFLSQAVQLAAMNLRNDLKSTAEDFRKDVAADGLAAANSASFAGAAFSAKIRKMRETALEEKHKGLKRALEVLPPEDGSPVPPVTVFLNLLGRVTANTLKLGLVDPGEHLNPELHQHHAHVVASKANRRNNVLHEPPLAELIALALPFTAGHRLEPPEISLHMENQSKVMSFCFRVLQERTNTGRVEMVLLTEIFAQLLGRSAAQCKDLAARVMARKILGANPQDVLEEMVPSLLGAKTDTMSDAEFEKKSTTIWLDRVTPNAFGRVAMTLVFSRYAKAGSTAQDVDGAAAGAGSAAGPLFPTKVMNQAMARLRAFEQLYLLRRSPALEKKETVGGPQPLFYPEDGDFADADGVLGAVRRASKTQLMLKRSRSRHKTKSRSSLSLSLPALPPAPPITAFSSAEDVGASLPDMPSLRISSGEQSGGPNNPENDFVFESLLSNQQAQSDETADMLHSHRVMLAGVARLVRALAYLLEYVEHLQTNIVKNPNSTGEDVKHARVQLRLLLDFQRALLEKANALQLTTAFKFFFRPDVAQGYIASERKTSGAPTPLFSENYPRAFEFEKLPGVFTGDWVDVSLPVVLEAAESGIASIDDDAGGVVAESKEGTVAAKETTGAAGSETLFAEFLRGQAEGKQRQEELTGDKEPEHVPKAMTRDFVEAEKLSKFLFSETDVVRFPEERWREGDDPFLETGEYDSNGSTVVSEGEDDDEDSGGVATTRQMMTGTSAYPSKGGAAAKAGQRAVSFQSGSGEGNSGGANLFYSYVEGRVEDTGNADEDETFSSPVSSCSSLLDYPPGRSLSGSPDASRDEGDRGAELDFVTEQNEGTVAGHDRISLCGRPSFLFYAEAEHGLDMDSGASSSRSSRSSALGGSQGELSRSFVEFDTRSGSWEAEEHDGRDAFSSSFNLEGGGGSVVVSDESDFYFSTRNYAQWSQHISLDGERAVAPNSAGNFYSSMLATTSSWRRSASVLSDRGGTSCSLVSISSFASTPRDHVDVDRFAAPRRPFLFMADSDHNGKKLNRHLPATTTFLYGLLVASINSKEYANFGVSGWEQSSVDTGVLSDESLSGKEKVRRLFGVEFEWREFPFVTVAKVESTNADGTKTRAASGNIAEGDMLLLLNGDRITTVSQMGELCSSPDEAVCNLVGNKIAGGKKGQLLFFRKKYHNTLAQLGVEESGLKLGVQHDGSGKVTVVDEHGWAAKNRLQVGDRILFIDADFVFRKPEKMDKFSMTTTTNGRSVFSEEDLKLGTQILVKRNPPGFPEDIYARESNVGRPLPRPWRAGIAGKESAGPSGSAATASMAPISSSMAPSSAIASMAPISSSMASNAHAPTTSAAPATVSSSSMSSDRKMLNKSLTATPTFHYALLAASISSKEYANFGISGWEQSSADTAVLQDTSLSPTEKVLTLFGVEFDWSQFPFVIVSKLQATNPADGSKTRAASSGIVEGDMLLLLNGERITTVGQMADLCKSGPDEAVLSLVEKRISGGKKAQFLFFRKKYQTTLVQVGVTESGLKLGVQHDGSGKLTEVAEGGFASRTGLAVGDRIVFVDADFVFRKPEKLQQFLDAEELKVGTQMLAKRNPPGFPSEMYKRESNVARPFPRLWREAIAAGGTARSSASAAAPPAPVAGVPSPSISPTSAAAGAATTSSSSMRSDRKMLNKSLTATTTFHYALLAASISSKEYANFGISGWEQSSVDTAVLQDTSLSPTEKVLMLFGVQFDWSQFPFVTVSKLQATNPSDGSKTRAANGGIMEGDMLLLLNSERITTVGQMADLCKSGPDEAVLSLVEKRISGGKKAQFLFFRKKYQTTLVQVGVTESGLKLGVQHDGSGKLTEVAEGGFASRTGLAVGDRIVFVDADFVFRKPEKLQQFLDAEELKVGTQILAKRNPPGFPSEMYKRESNVARPFPRLWREAIAAGGTARSSPSAAAPPAPVAGVPSSSISPTTTSAAAAAAPTGSSSMSSDRKMLNKSLTATTTFHYALLAASISSKEYANFGISGWEQSSVDTAVLQDTSLSPTEKVLTLFGVEFDWSQFPFVTVSRLQATNPSDGSKTRAASSGIVEGDMLLLLNGERITTIGQMADLCKSGPDEAVLSLVEKRISGGKNKAQFLFLRKKYQTTLVQVGVTESGLKLGVKHDGSGKLTEVAEGGFASRTRLAVGDRIVFVDADFVFRKPEKLQQFVDAEELKVGTQILAKRNPPGFPPEMYQRESNVGRPLPKAWRAAIAAAGTASPSAPLLAAASSTASAPPAARKRHGPPTPTFLYGILAASLSSKEYANFGISGWEQGSLDTGVASDSGLPGPEKMLKLFGISLDWRRFPIVVVSKIQPTHADGTASRAASGNISQGDMLVLLNGERITTLAQMGDMGKSPDDVVVELVAKRIAEQKRAQLVFFRKKYHATLVQLGVAEGASRKFGIETDGTGKVTKVVGDRDTSWAAANKLTAGDRILLVENDFVFKKPEKLTPMLEDGFELKTGTQILIQRKPPGFGDDVRDLESYITRPLPKKWRDVVGEAEPPEAPAGAPAPPSRTNLQIVPTANQPSTTQFLYGILAASVPATSYAEFGMTGWEQRSWDDKVLADESLNAKQKISKLFGMSLDFNDFPVVRARDIVRTQPDPKSGETVKTRAAAGGIVEGDMLLLLNGNRVTTIAQVEGVESPHAAVLQLCKDRIAGEKKVGFLFFRKKYQETLVQLPVVGGDTPLGVVAMDKEKITGEVGASTTTSGGNSNSSSFAARYQLQSGDQIVFIDADFVFKKPEKAEKFLGAQPAELLKDGTQVLLRRRGKGTSATPGNETAYAGFPADLFEGESNFRRKMSSAWEKAIDRKAQKRPAVVSPSSGSKIVSAKNFRAVAEQAPAGVDLDAIAAAAAATASQAQHDDKQVIFVRKKLKPREDAAAAMLREERRKRRAQAKRSGSRLIDLQQDEMAEQHKKRRRLQKRYLERNETPAIRGIGGRESKLLDDAAALFGSFEGGNRLFGAAVSALSAEDDAAAGGGGETSRSNRPPLRDPLDVDDQGTVLQEAGGDPEPVRVVPYLLAEECAFLRAFLEWLELIRQGPKFGFDARSLMGAMGDGSGSGNFLAGGIGFALAMFGEGAPEPPAFDDSHGVGNGSAQNKFRALAKLSDSALEKHLQAAMVEETSKLEDHVEYLRRLALRKYERLLAIRDKYLQTLSITCRSRIAYEFGLDNDSHFFCESTEVLLHQTEIRVCNARELVRKEGGQGDGSAFGFGLQLTRLGPDGTIIDKIQKRRLYIKQKWKHLWRRVCLVLHVTKSFSSLLPVYGKRGLNYRMKQLAGLLVKARGAVEDFAVGVVSDAVEDGEDPASSAGGSGAVVKQIALATGERDTAKRRLFAMRDFLEPDIVVEGSSHVDHQRALENKGVLRETPQETARKLQLKQGQGVAELRLLMPEIDWRKLEQERTVRRARLLFGADGISAVGAAGASPTANFGGVGEQADDDLPRSSSPSPVASPASDRSRSLSRGRSGSQLSPRGPPQRKRVRPMGGDASLDATSPSRRSSRRRDTEKAKQRRRFKFATLWRGEDETATAIAEKAQRKKRADSTTVDQEPQPQAGGAAATTTVGPHHNTLPAGHLAYKEIAYVLHDPVLDALILPVKAKAARRELQAAVFEPDGMIRRQMDMKLTGNFRTLQTAAKLEVAAIKHENEFLDRVLHREKTKILLSASKNALGTALVPDESYRLPAEDGELGEDAGLDPDSFFPLTLGGGGRRNLVHNPWMLQVSRGGRLNNKPDEDTNAPRLLESPILGGVSRSPAGRRAGSSSPDFGPFSRSVSPMGAYGRTRNSNSTRFVIPKLTRGKQRSRSNSPEKRVTFADDGRGGAENASGYGPEAEVQKLKRSNENSDEEREKTLRIRIAGQQNFDETAFLKHLRENVASHPNQVRAVREKRLQYHN